MEQTPRPGITGAHTVPNGKDPHPRDVLMKNAEKHSLAITDLKFAQLMDEDDELRCLRDEFFYPKCGELPMEEVNSDLANCQEECIYLATHGLGLQPRGVKDCIQRELDKWSKMALYSITKGEFPWVLYDEYLQTQIAKLVGAESDEVVVMNGLTVNEHLLLVSFYQPKPERYKILLEDHAFPSDHYAVESQVRLHGYDPSDAMILIKPRKGENTIRTEDIIQLLEKEGDSIAVVLLPGVQYLTGQLFEMKEITIAAQTKGCYVGFDLGHAIGNVEIDLHEWGVDFACWCSNKYLSAGYGGIGGIFLHKKHDGNNFPKLHGWWSHKLETRYDMTNQFEPSSGASVYKISTPPILLCAAMEASLKVFGQVSMSAVRKKSTLLTGYLELLLNRYLPKSENVKSSLEIITPSDPNQRGAQLSLRILGVSADYVYKELTKRAIVIDKREPDIIRISPAPLYNSFTEVHRFAHIFKQILRK